jgi:hypothetical protein
MVLEEQFALRGIKITESSWNEPKSLLIPVQELFLN